MTNKEIKTLTAFYNTRIESLDFAIDTINISGNVAAGVRTCSELMIMRREYQFKLDTLIENKLKINA